MAITSLAYVDHSTSTSSTINAPAAINAGDVLVLVQAAEGVASSPADVTPTDFTDIGTVAGAPMRVSAKFKIADGSEDGASITGMSGAVANYKVLFQYRGNGPVTGLTASTPVSTAAIGNPAQQTVAASAGTPPVLGIATFANESAGNSISPRTTSITPDHAINPSVHFYAHDFVQNSAPADYTFDMDDEGDRNCLFGFYLHAFLGGVAAVKADLLQSPLTRPILLKGLGR